MCRPTVQKRPAGSLSGTGPTVELYFGPASPTRSRIHVDQSDAESSSAMLGLYTQHNKQRIKLEQIHKANCPQNRQRDSRKMKH